MIKNLVNMVRTQKGLEVVYVKEVYTDDDITERLLPFIKEFNLLLKENRQESFVEIFKRILVNEFDKIKESADYKEKLTTIQNRRLGKLLTEGKIDLDNPDQIRELKAQIEAEITIDDLVTPNYYCGLQKIQDLTAAVKYIKLEQTILPVPTVHCVMSKNIVDNTDSKITSLKRFFSTEIITLLDKLTMLFDAKNNITRLKSLSMLEVPEIYILSVYHKYPELHSKDYYLRIMHYTIRKDNSGNKWVIYSNSQGKIVSFCLNNMTGEDYANFIYTKSISNLMLTPCCSKEKITILKSFGFSSMNLTFATETMLDQLYPFLKMEKNSQQFLFRLFGIDAQISPVIDDAVPYSPDVTDLNHMKYLFDLQLKIFSTYYIWTTSLLPEWSILPFFGMLSKPIAKELYYFLYEKSLTANFSSFYLRKDLDREIYSMVSLISVYDYYEKKTGITDENYTEIAAAIPSLLEQDPNIMAICNNVVVIDTMTDIPCPYWNLKVKIVWSEDSFLLASYNGEVVLNCGMEFHNIVYNRARMNNFLGGFSTTIDDNRYMVRKYVENDLPIYTEINLNDVYTEGNKPEDTSYN